MINDLILQYKREKEILLGKNYVMRDKLESARKFLDSDLIKVITGPRRAGKSVFAILLLKDKDFAYINFDDENLLKIENQDEIIKGIFEVYKKPQFILFDEIQNLKNWELFVNKLQRRGYNLILTGSNARLLSKELATALTGRHFAIEVLPFSFNEFLRARGLEFNRESLLLPETKGKILNTLTEFLKNGGYPEIVVKNLDTKSYLDTLFDAVLLKDVVKRYKVRFTQKIYDLALYLISNFSGEFSYNKLKNILKFNSVNTIQNYARYIEESYLVILLNRFSYKMKEQLKSPKKIYAIDLGLIAAKSFQFSPNTGRLMENLVLVELLKKDYKPNENVFYYKTRNQKEVDFVLKDNLEIKTLIQVLYQTDDLTVEKRELKALVEASQELNCEDLLVITWDKEGETMIKKKKIKFIPLWKWLSSSY
ncbi:MAG: ATP-binding protein [candidate division WOR-3 bacterium]